VVSEGFSGAAAALAERPAGLDACGLAHKLPRVFNG